MSSVVIDYDKLSTVAKAALNASSEMNSYINDLTKKVTKKYSEITGGASSKTSNSEYYVNQKISKLKKKKEYYSTFSESITNFSKKAKEADSYVAKKIKASTGNFIEKHDYIEVNWWTELKEFFVELKNACPLFSAISAVISQTIDIYKGLFEDIKHWYKCGGGKEIIGVVLSVAGAVAAVVVAIAACVPPICGIVAICAAISAVIAACNAIVNVVTSSQALKAKKNGDPGWAKVYSGRDTMQDCLRDVRWTGGLSFLNEAGPWLALGLDLTEAFCGAVALVDGIHKIKNVFKEMKIYSNRSGKKSFGSVFKDYLFNRETSASTKANPQKMRDLIQERADLRTLRDYKLTKARTVKAYKDSLDDQFKSLKKWQQFFKTAEKSKYITVPKNISKYGNKLLDFTVGGGASWGKAAKNAWSDFSGTYKSTGLIDSAYSLFDSKPSSIAKDILDIGKNIKWQSYKEGLKHNYSKSVSFDFSKLKMGEFYKFSSNGLPAGSGKGGGGFR